MNLGVLTFPRSSVTASADAIDLTEWTRILAFDGAPGTRRVGIPADVSEVLIIAVGAGGSGRCDVNTATGIACGGGGGAFVAAICPVTPATMVDYTVGAGGAAKQRTSSGATNGSAGTSTTIGSLITAGGGSGGNTTTAAGGSASALTATKVLAAFSGGASGDITAATGTSQATGGGSAGSPFSAGYASGAIPATTSNASATGGASWWASSAAVNDTVSGGAGQSASTNATGGGPASLFSDVDQRYTGTPIGQDAFLEFILTCALGADAAVAASRSNTTPDTWGVVPDATGRCGGSGATAASGTSSDNGTLQAGDGGHFAGGGAVRVNCNGDLTGTATAAIAGDGGRFGGGGGAATRVVSGGKVVTVTAGSGRIGGGGGGCAAVSPATNGTITSGAGGDGFLMVLARG